MTQPPKNHHIFGNINHKQYVCNHFKSIFISHILKKKSFSENSTQIQRLYSKLIAANFGEHFLSPDPIPRECSKNYKS